MATNNRRPLYLSSTKDKDILKYIEPLLKTYSFSGLIRELIRDGIKYRSTPKTRINSQEKHVLQSNTSSLDTPLKNIKLTEKEISDEDIANKLDNF